MRVETAELRNVLVFRPAPHRDDRGFFTRTFDAEVAAAHGVDPHAFVRTPSRGRAAGRCGGCTDVGERARRSSSAVRVAPSST